MANFSNILNEEARVTLLQPGLSIHSGRLERFQLCLHHLDDLLWRPVDLQPGLCVGDHSSDLMIRPLGFHEPVDTPLQIGLAEVILHRPLVRAFLKSVSEDFQVFFGDVFRRRLQTILLTDVDEQIVGLFRIALNTMEVTTPFTRDVVQPVESHFPSPTVDLDFGLTTPSSVVDEAFPVGAGAKIHRVGKASTFYRLGIQQIRLPASTPVLLDLLAQFPLVLDVELGVDHLAQLTTFDAHVPLDASLDEGVFTKPFVRVERGPSAEKPQDKAENCRSRFHGFLQTT